MRNILSFILYEVSTKTIQINSLGDEKVYVERPRNVRQ